MKHKTKENVYCCIISLICVVICGICYNILGDTFLCISLITSCSLCIVILMTYIIAETLLIKVKEKLHV